MDYEGVYLVGKRKLCLLVIYCAKRTYRLFVVIDFKKPSGSENWHPLTRALCRKRQAHFGDWVSDPLDRESLGSWGSQAGNHPGVQPHQERTPYDCHTDPRSDEETVCRTPHLIWWRDHILLARTQRPGQVRGPAKPLGRPCDDGQNLVHCSSWGQGPGRRACGRKRPCLYECSPNVWPRHDESFVCQLGCCLDQCRQPHIISSWL